MLPIPRTAFRTLLVLLVAALGSACGGSDGGGGGTKEYERGMRKVERRISEASEQASTTAPDTTEAERAQLIRAQGTALAAAAEEADTLDPPKDAAKAHRQIVLALREEAALFRQLAEATEAQDEQAYAKSLNRLARVNDRLTKASEQLEDAGYDLSTEPER